MNYTSEAVKALKDISREMSAIRRALEDIKRHNGKPPHVAHWILAPMGDAAYCSACGLEIPVEDSTTFAEKLTERPLMCPNCRAIMCEEVTIS